MDQKKNLILLKGEDKTLKVQSCHYNSKTEKYEVSFGGDRIYTYNRDSVEWMQNPRALNPAMYQISHEGKGLTHIALLLEFTGSDTFWHLVFESGAYRTIRKNELKISESCLSEKEAQDKLSYLKDLARVGELKTADGESLLTLYSRRSCSNSEERSTNG